MGKRGCEEEEYWSNEKGKEEEKNGKRNKWVWLRVYIL